MLIYRGVNPSRSITCGIELYPKKLNPTSKIDPWKSTTILESLRPNITDGYFHSDLFPDSNRIAIIYELPIQLITYLTSIHQTQSSFVHHKIPPRKHPQKQNLIGTLESSPIFGVKITTYLSCHHLEMFFSMLFSRQFLKTYYVATRRYSLADGLMAFPPPKISPFQTAERRGLPLRGGTHMKTTWDFWSWFWLFSTSKCLKNTQKQKFRWRGAPQNISQIHTLRKNSTNCSC